MLHLFIEIVFLCFFFLQKQSHIIKQIILITIL